MWNQFCFGNSCIYWNYYVFVRRSKQGHCTTEESRFSCKVRFLFKLWRITIVSGLSNIPHQIHSLSWIDSNLDDRWRELVVLPALVVWSLIISVPLPGIYCRYSVFRKINHIKVRQNFQQTVSHALIFKNLKVLC